MEAVNAAQARMKEMVTSRYGCIGTSMDCLEELEVGFDVHGEDENAVTLDEGEEIFDEGAHIRRHPFRVFPLHPIPELEHEIELVRFMLELPHGSRGQVLHNFDRDSLDEKL